MHIARRDSTVCAVILGLSAFVLGCGSTSTETKPTASSIKPVGDLMDSLVKLNASGELSNALIQFAFLYEGNAPDVRTAKREAMLSKAAWKRLGEQTLFVSTTVGEGLPVPLQDLVSSTKDPITKQRLQKSQTVLLVRYLGPKLEGDQHVPLFFKMAAGAAGSFLLGLDLSTRKLLSSEALSGWLAQRSVMFAEQVVPGIERGEKGTITFFTRGMAKFGLPDLERTGVARQDARQAFAQFQGLINKALEKKYLKIGDRFEGYLLGACQRQKIAIERECVNLGVISK